MKTGILVLLCAVAASYAPSASAEVITIPVGQQGGALEHIKRPTRGMRSAAVLAAFGEPLTMAPAVGEPPISHWTYEHFKVYFESDVVIHSVLEHAPQHPVTE